MLNPRPRRGRVVQFGFGYNDSWSLTFREYSEGVIEIMTRNFPRMILFGQMLLLVGPMEEARPS